MTIKTKLALAAVLFSAVASPALAGDQDTATLLATSGRILGIATAPSAGAYASARPVVPAIRSAEMTINDRLALGHN